MRVSTKGQVTIPQELREEFGIIPGCEVAIRAKDGRLVIEKTGNSGRGKAIVERMAGQGKLGMSTDELLALTRSDV